MKHWYAIPVTLSQCSTGVSFLGFYRISRWNYWKAILIWLKLICNYKDRSFYSLSIIKTDFYWSRGHRFTICLLHQVNIESQPVQEKVTQMLSILRFSWSNGDKLYYIHIDTVVVIFSHYDLFFEISVLYSCTRQADVGDKIQV